MKTFFQKIRTYAVTHKITSTLIALFVLFGGYYTYGKLTSTAGETRYVTDTVQKGTLVVSVTGSGQVSALNQVELMPKAPGQVTSIKVSAGQEVKAGTLLVTLDSTDAQKAVRDAQVNLDSAKLSLQKLMQPADALSLAQSQDTLARAQVALQNAKADLVTSKENGFNTLANSFITLPNIMTGLDSTLYSIVRSTGSNQENIDFYANSIVNYAPSVVSFKTDADTKYKAARAAYDQNFQDYKNVGRDSDMASILAMLKETTNTTRLIADSIKSANNLIQFYEDQLTVHDLTPAPQAASSITTLNDYTTQINSLLTSLLSIQSTIQSDENTIISSEQTINESNLSLEKLKAGADTLDIQTSQLSVKQRQNALLDAEQTLSNYYVYAPFDGTVAKVNVKKLDQASSGTSVVTFVTPQQMAVISLNEVDAAKVKVGQKATMTFDAIDGLTITGEVASVDTVGTVSQGVVTYTVQISFDTQDARVKPGMTVNASVVTDVRTDALMIPNGAVKTANGTSYVEVFNPNLTNSSGQTGTPSKTPPSQKTVTVGISNDTSTEVLTGLSEGDQIVVRSIAPGTQTTATTGSTRSLFGGGGGRAGG